MDTNLHLCWLASTGPETSIASTACSGSVLYGQQWRRRFGLWVISTCTDPVLALNFPLHLSVSRVKTASQLLHLQENTEVLASVNEQNMTGRLTDAEKYLTFRLLRSLNFRFICSLVARNTTSVLARKNTNADFISLQPPNQIISKSVGVVFLCEVLRAHRRMLGVFQVSTF